MAHVQWKSAGMSALRAQRAVVDIENEGMEDGRFMVWLRPAWKVAGPHGPEGCRAFTNCRAALAWVKSARIVEG